MVKSKKIFTLCILILLSIIVTSCDSNKEKTNEKFDMSIKIKNNFDEKWIFTPDIPLWTYTIDYTGKKMYFYVDSYSFPEHPILSDFWLKPSNDTACLFYTIIRKKNSDKNNYEGNLDYICDKGEYYFSATIESNQSLYNPETIWKDRTIYLYIIVN